MILVPAAAVIPDIMGECIGYLRVARRRIYMAVPRASSERVLNTATLGPGQSGTLRVSLCVVGCSSCRPTLGGQPFLREGGPSGLFSEEPRVVSGEGRGELRG